MPATINGFPGDTLIQYGDEKLLYNQTMNLASALFNTMTMTGPDGPLLNEGKKLVSDAAAAFSRGDKSTADAYAKKVLDFYVTRNFPELAGIWKGYRQTDSGLSFLDAVIATYRIGMIGYNYRTGGSGADIYHDHLKRLKEFFYKPNTENYRNALKAVETIANSTVDPNVAEAAQQLHLTLKRLSR